MTYNYLSELLQFTKCENIIGSLLLMFKSLSYLGKYNI